MNHSSNFHWVRYVILVFTFFVYSSAYLFAQEAPNADILRPSREVSSLKVQQDQLALIKRRFRGTQEQTWAVVNIACLTFLFGAFCAIWAQNTGRNPLLWFGAGVLFSVLTVLVILRKNSRYRHRKHYHRGRRNYTYLENY